MEELLKFVEITHKFQQVRRAVYATGENRDENDAEHSFQLALVAWYLAASRKFKLDTTKLIKYALVHDLVEVHAGDTDAFGADDEWKRSKHEREAAAAVQLRQEFPDFPELHELITVYEARGDEEAKFVYALDKLLPPMNIYLDGGRIFRERKITLEMVKHEKLDKLSVSPEVLALFHELIPILEREQGNLF